MDSYPHIILDTATSVRMILDEQDRDIIKLRRIVQDYEPYLEVSPMTVSSVIECLKIELKSRQEEENLTDNFLRQEIEKLTYNFFDLVRVNSEEGIDYDAIMKEASNLNPYPDFPEVDFEDFTNLVFAKEISFTSIFLTQEKEIFEEIISNREGFSDYEDLKICDLAEFIDWMSEKEFPNIVMVRTPAGEAIRLTVYRDEISNDNDKYPTPVDFAYRLHTNIGHRCKEALVNGIKVPLNTQLKNGDIVEIIENKDACPNPDKKWANFVSTKYAKTKILKWHKDWTKNIGKNKVIEEFGVQYSLNGETYRKVALALNCKSTSELFLEIGSKKISIEKIKEQIDLIISDRLNGIGCCHHRSKTTGFHVPIEGIEFNCIARIASCCLPFPENVNIVGIIDNGHSQKKMSIHAKNCSRIIPIDRGKIKDLKWNCRHCTLDLQVKMMNRVDSLPVFLEKLNEISSLRYKVIKFDADEREFATLRIYLLITTRQEMEKISTRIKKISKDIRHVNIKGIYPGLKEFTQV